MYCNGRCCNLLTAIALFFSIPFSGFSQHQITGKVLDSSNRQPVHYASISTKASRNAGAISDTTGYFSFWYPKAIKPTDSVIISAIDYKASRVSLSNLMERNEILLEPKPNIMENVVVVSTLKGNPQQFGYFRAWKEKNNNGEIGQVISVPGSRIQIGSVQFKVNKNYDTCWVKLHIRDVGPGGLPENELLKREVVIPVTINNGLVDFDLNWETFRLPNKNLYVGFEVLNCSSTTSQFPSFLFMGSEEGQNIYRNRKDADWELSSLYTIYIKLMMK